MANGKDNVKRNRLKEPDKTKYELYDILKMEVGICGNWNVLVANLKRQGVEVYFKHNGQTGEIQGVVFTKNGYHFNGSLGLLNGSGSSFNATDVEANQEMTEILRRKKKRKRGMML